MRYYCQGVWPYLQIWEIAPSCLKHMNCFIRIHIDQCLLLPAPGYTAGFQRFKRCAYIILLLFNFNFYIFLLCLVSIEISNCGEPYGLMAKLLDCGLKVSELELQSRYYIHFQTNTLWNGMNPLIPPGMG